MIPALVVLPATVLGPGGLAGLSACASVLAPGRVVVASAQRSARGEILDEFVVAAALRAAAGPATREGLRIGVLARVAQGRAASVVAREATTAQLLGACDVVVLDGAPAACADAAAVLAALFSPGVHTVTSGAERVLDAPNLPGPSVPGGPPVVWRDGTSLRAMGPRGSEVVGEVLDVVPGDPLPAPAEGVLVVLDSPLVAPDELAATLRR